MKTFARQFIVFSVVGTLAAVIHFTILILSVQWLDLNPVLGSVFGFISALLVNYLLNYHITFRSRYKHVATSPRFFVIALSGLGINTMIMYALTEWLHYLISQVCAAGVVLLWNFLCNRYWTFREACLVRH